MMKVFKEISLCILVGFTSFAIFVLLGNVYDPKAHSTLLNIVVWVGEGLISYAIYIFIPVFNKRKVFYLDGFALGSAYLAIVITCLARQQTFNEYLYLDALAFLSALLPFGEITWRITKNGFELKKQKTISEDMCFKIETLPIWEQKPMKAIIIGMKDKDAFSIREAALITEIGERKTRQLLNDAVDAGILLADGKTSNKRFQIKGDIK